MIWVRASYWIGAAVGFLIALPMILSALPPFSAEKTPFPPWADAEFFLRMGGSFILGWSALLIWADRKPIERKGILLLSLFPVLSMSAAIEIYATTSAGLSCTTRLPFWLVEGGLGLLFSFSYFKARGTYTKWWSSRD